MGKKKRKCQCKLCHVKRKAWEEEDFYGINDKYTGKPMIVLKKHQSHLDGNYDRDRVIKLKEKYYPKLFVNPEDLMGVNLEREHWFTVLERSKF